MCNTSCISVVYECQLILHVTLRRGQSWLITPCWDSSLLVLLDYSHFYAVGHKSKIHRYFVSLCWSLCGVVYGWCREYLHYQWSSNCFFLSEKMLVTVWVPICGCHVSSLYGAPWDKNPKRINCLRLLLLWHHVLALHRFLLNLKMFACPKILFWLFCVCALLYTDGCTKNTSMPLIWDNHR